MPELDDTIEVEKFEDDIKMDTFRSGRLRKWSEHQGFYWCATDTIPTGCGAVLIEGLSIEP